MSLLVSLMLSLLIFMFPCSLNSLSGSDPTLLRCLEPVVHILLLSLAMGSLSILHILQSKFQKRRMGESKRMKRPLVQGKDDRHNRR